LGIGPKPEKVDLANWVVSAFSEEDRKVMDGLYAVVPDIVKEFVVEL
jgi:peptidyl-tRNA hydrolase